MWKQLSAYFGLTVALVIFAALCTVTSKESANAGSKYTDVDFEQAFGQRDQALEALAQKVEELDKTCVKKAVENENLPKIK